MNVVNILDSASTSIICTFCNKLAPHYRLHNAYFLRQNPSWRHSPCDQVMLSGAKNLSGPQTEASTAWFGCKVHVCQLCKRKLSKSGAVMSCSLPYYVYLFNYTFSANTFFKFQWFWCKINAITMNLPPVGKDRDGKGDCLLDSVAWNGPQISGWSIATLRHGQSQPKKI